MTIQLYCDPCTVNSRKVIAGLEEMKVDYELNYINFFTAEHKSEKYSKINPHQTVPAATDGDLTLTESNAILMYAADKVGNDQMYPKDLKKRADINRLLLWEASSWFPTTYVYLVENVVKPLMKGEPDQKVLDNEASKFHRSASFLEARLSSTKWLAGDYVTIADIAIAAPMQVYKEQKLPLEDYPNLKRWMAEGIEQLDSWKKTAAAVEKALFPDRVRTPASVRTVVNYTKAVDRPTEVYFFESDKAKDTHAPGDAPVEVDISDGWPLVKEFSLDKNGFSVHKFEGKDHAWDDDDEVRSNFYPEVVEFLKATVGAKRVLVFDHTIRSEKNAQKKLTDEKSTSQRTPVMLVHCDYTAESGPVRVTQLLGNEAEDLLSRRLAFLNVWRPLNVVEERPLAMCDVQSCADDDFFKLLLHYRDRVGENYVMSPNPRHRWWYFPKMTPQEVILLKTYDSATDGRARFVGHTAFEDPTTKPNVPMRESIEIRTICFF